MSSIPKSFVQKLVTCSILSILLLACVPAAIAQPDTSVNYKILNKASGLALGIQYASQTAGAPALQWTDNGTPDHLWHLIPAVGNHWKMINVNSAEVLGITYAELTSGATAVQWADNETDDHLWNVITNADGTVKLQNVNSGLVLGIQGASADAGALAEQETDTGAASQSWTLTPSGTAYPDSIPVFGDTDIHDPSMVRTPAGQYYLLGTHYGIPMKQSSDLIHWTDVGQAFSTIPAWTNNYDGDDADLWAPDISFHNGQYYLYYAASTFGTRNSGIGVATSPTAAPGSFVDQGLIIASGFINNAWTAFNAIDPSLLVDNDGNWWMNFGSYSEDGIDMLQIDPSTGKQLASNPTIYNLAKRFGGTNSGFNEIEGSFIYPHGGYYYLFASFDGCCAGTASTYHIVVGRSTSPTGPYVDRGGVNMTDGGGTIVLATHGRFIGPGGQGVLHDPAGDLLYYHFYNGEENGYPRLGEDFLSWTSDGWPYVGNQPAQTPVTLTVSATQQTYPQWANLVVTVQPANNVIPTGKVTIFDGGTAILTRTLGGDGKAYFTTNTPLSAGTHILTATYAGDANYPSGTSAAVTVTVAAAPVNMGISCWGGTPYGVNYSCTASLSSSAGSATGALTYTVDAGAVASIPIANGTAQWSIAKPSAGTHSLVISYAGNGNFAAAPAQTISFTVQPAPTQIQLTPSSWYQPATSPLSLSASLTSWSAGAPSGTVTFYDSGTPIGTAAIVSGKASLTLTSETAGQHQFTAAYSSDPNFAAVVSSAVTVTTY